MPSEFTEVFEITAKPRELEMPRWTVQTILDTMPADPLAAWMRGLGFDPQRGDVIFVPTQMARHLGPYRPAYVVPRDDIHNPVLCRRF